jgi:hypothetical protein
MKTPFRFILACLSGLAASGSVFAQPDTRVAIPQGRLESAAYLSESDLLSEEWSAQFQAARRFVRARQCAARTPNPLIYIAPPLGAGARGEAAEGRPVSQRAGSGLDLPLRVSTVANFPNEYLRDITALAQTPGVPSALAEKLQLEIQPNYEKLSARVRLLIGEFDPRSCTRETVVRTRWNSIIDIPVTP